MIGREIRELRLDLGLTQHTLGGRLGVAAATISSWERGYLCPSKLHHAALDELRDRPMSLTGACTPFDLRRLDAARTAVLAELVALRDVLRVQLSEMAHPHGDL